MDQYLTHPAGVPVTNTVTDALSVVVEREMPNPPQKNLARAHATNLIEGWLMKNDFKPVGTTVSIFTQTGALSTWAAYGLESAVTWTLTPTSTGTHLRMEQSGFRPDQRHAYHGAKGGWQQFFVALEVLARID
jgi:uncharacterized protein YndB with AHSA1/START domain